MILTVYLIVRKAVLLLVLELAKGLQLKICQLADIGTFTEMFSEHCPHK